MERGHGGVVGVLVVAVAIVALSGCTESVGSGETVVDLQFFGTAWAGAEVCVAGECGVVGAADEVVVAPAVVGSVLDVTVAHGGASADFERDFRSDVEAMGLDPATAQTDSVSLAVIARPDGECAIYLTNHVIDGLTAFSSLPGEMELETLCGPFAGL